MGELLLSSVRSVGMPGYSFLSARLGFYEIATLAGQGGMGEVYVARDSKPGRDVAIKSVWVGYESDKSGRSGIYVTRFGVRGPEFQITPGGGQSLRSRFPLPDEHGNSDTRRTETHLVPLCAGVATASATPGTSPLPCGIVPDDPFGLAGAPD